MADFVYPPLDLGENNIRLLQVKKGGWPNNVSCFLVEASTNEDEAVPYKALSYTWGDIEKDSESHPYLPFIFVDDQRFDATPNLRLALAHIQNSNHDVMLWTDAICINQTDNRERGHQVKQMGRIYRNAEEVLIWLGPSDEEIENLFSMINLIDQRATKLPVRETWAEHCIRIMTTQN
ncbi:HET-domain-containing protein [Fusarium austroafricanum]|uniref:HET-domain-containing protein n=1 Tax=Fusarium austroafricanum TaxID=2364996 RepID=A0A8H4NL50_9HYPO|nr:HET-domain-containing protein [Fusarium austroafricanum]